MAPEVFSGIYSTKCDSWSCGVVMYLLLTNHNPFAGLSEAEIREKIDTFASDFNGTYKWI
jgi:calcium-dependent protein kinase